MVEGVNVRKKAVRRSSERPQGGIIQVECPLHLSNVMLQEKYDARRAKRGQAASAPPQNASAPAPAGTESKQ